MVNLGIIDCLIKEPGLYMIAGVTGVGKSRFVTNMIEDFNTRNNEKRSVYCYSSEKNSQLLGKADQTKIINLSLLPCSTGHIMLEALWEYEDNGLSLIVVDDYRFLLRSEFYFYNNRYSKKERLVCILTRLKIMSEIFNIPVILTSGVDDDYIYGRKEKIPKISDIPDGKFIKPLIDKFILLYREEMYDQNTDKKHLMECRLYEPVDKRITDYLYVCHPEITRYVEVSEGCRKDYV